MKVCVIPDVHLKPEIFDKADKIECDQYVCLGDLVDDFGAEQADYLRTFERVNEFFKKHRNATMLWGNHDWAYWAQKNCSGHRYEYHFLVLNWLESFSEKFQKPQVITQIDNILFSHGGLTMSFFQYCQNDETEFLDMQPKLEHCISVANEMGTKKDTRLWEDDSPLWARPQAYTINMHPHVQVVGHTPVEKPCCNANIISTDVFSTYSDGRPYGNQKLIVIDTENYEYNEY